MYRTVLKVVLICLLGAAMLVSIRIYLVEPDEMATYCIPHRAEFLCRLRGVTIDGFARHLFGEISIAAAVLSAICRLRYFALLAVMSGLAGVILYDFDLSALGLLAGALLFARLDVKVRQDRNRKQRAPYTPV